VDFSQYINDGLLFTIKHWREAVIVAYDQTNSSISDLVYSIHGTDGSTGLTPVSTLEFVDDVTKLEVAYEDYFEETGGIKNIFVTKLMPNSQVSFESYC
jgi:hypothetical protein